MSFPPDTYAVSVPKFLPINFRIRGLAHTDLLWPKNEGEAVLLRIRFIGGSVKERDLVLSCADEWAKHTSLRFLESKDRDSEIRVGFDTALGNWSYIGTESVHWKLGFHNASMNLQDVETGIILHEFGHAIGLDHEHQHPSSPLEWNEQRVIEDLSGPPNNWSRDKIRRNVLERFASDDLEVTAYDPESIMMYEFPKEWLVAGSPPKRNSQLSEGDKVFVRFLYGGHK